MRTTVRIDDDLYRDVKARAAQQGRTVASVLEDAVRVGMGRPTDREPTPFANKPSGRGGLLPGIDLSDNSSLSELLESATPLEQMR